MKDPISAIGNLSVKNPARYLILTRLRTYFGLNFRESCTVLTDVLINCLALSRAIRTAAKANDFDRIVELASSTLVFSQRLTFEELEYAARNLHAAGESKNEDELQTATEKIQRVFKKLDLDSSLPNSNNTLEDELA